MTLHNVTASGGETIDGAVVATAANAALEGQYLKLVPKRFAWWYPYEAVLTAVQNVPRVKNPQITRVSGTELVITYEEYVPFALWCDGVDDARCVFIDETGYAFTEAPVLVGGSLGRYVSTDVTPEIRTYAPFAQDVASFEKWLLELESVTPLAADVIEIDAMRDAYVRVAGGGEIKLSLKDDLGHVLENLVSILASKEFSDITPGTFQYIDLRFGSKVFVNTELASTASTTASTTDGVASSTALTSVVEDIAASVSQVTEPTLRTVSTTTETAATSTEL